MARTVKFYACISMAFRAINSADFKKITT